jgi:hypothetical protein
MIRQFGPPTFFVTFILGVNNWPILMITFKNLHTQHFNENITNIDNSLNNKGLVISDPITCV